jgi:oxygen-independent coproporphyrinogen-3 oxidase
MESSSPTADHAPITRSATLSVIGGHVLPAYAFLPEELRSAAATVDAVYVHVPFCSTKCHYCDFYSLAGHLGEAVPFVDALERELLLQSKFLGTPSPKTIFLGGGTPTLLPAPSLKRLLTLLHTHLDLSHLEEFTIEANPNTFDAQKAAIAAAGGINRISFGAQSFVASELDTLQRDHDPASVATAFATARTAGISNLSCDLIFGIPGQTPASWEYSLAQALALDPQHLSCYSLTYEPNTAMTARLKKGEFQPLDEETELGMFEHVYARLRKAGFARYETSNYARIDPATGKAAVCRHNLTYWKGGNWMALGPSAGAHFALPAIRETAGAPIAWQWKNAGSLTHYLEALHPARPALPVAGLEVQTRQEWAAAVAIFWLRLADGLDYAEFEARTGIDPQPALRRALSNYAAFAPPLVELTARHARILDRGVQVSNRLLTDVLKAFEQQSPET